MKKKFLTLLGSALLGLVCTGAWGQTENLLKGWDGTGCAISNPKPSDFGWTSNKSVTWGTLNGSNERFTTNYTGYQTENGETYSYNATSDLSSKLLWLHFTSGQTYTYTFEGLKPGHAYRFTGLSAWHNNDETNKGKCNISIEGESLSYISMYVEVQTKQKLYPMESTFIVPLDESSTNFKMVVSNGNSTSMLALSAIGLYDLGEVAFSPYNKATNLDFCNGALNANVNTYIRDRSGDLDKKAQMNPVEGWYFKGKTGDATAGGVFAYGSGNWVGGSTNTVPETNPNEENQGNALGVVAVWGGVVNYVKPITFPAGIYKLQVLVYNQSGDSELKENLIGFVDTEGKKRFATTTSYKKGAWTEEVIYLPFVQETKGYLSIGYASNNVGNASAQHLFVDGITIEKKASFEEQTDLTFLMVNPSFEENNDVWNNGWTTDRGTTGNFDYKLLEENLNTNGATEGKYVLNAWAPQINYINVTQKVTLPAGVYELSAAVYSDKVKDQHVEAIANGINYKSATVASDKWETLSTEFIVSDESEVTIGIYSKGNNLSEDQYGWFRADNFKLTYLGDASANMTVADVKWGTFVAPFAVTIPEGVEAYTCDAVEGDVITTTEVETTIPANTPVLVHSEDLVNQTFYGKAVAIEDDPTCGVLVGTYAAKSAPVGSYVLQKNNDVFSFYKVGSGAQPTVGANRCYLSTSSSSTVLRFGDGTAIQSVEQQGETVIYDLTGRRVDAAAKGIYIVNGKKMLVK